MWNTYQEWLTEARKRYERKRQAAEDNFQLTGLRRYRREADEAENMTHALLAADNELRRIDAADAMLERRLDGLYQRGRTYAETLPPQEALEKILREIKFGNY